MNTYKVNPNLEQISLTFPILNTTSNNGYEELLRGIIREEKRKVSNEIKDAEKIRFRLADNGTNDLVNGGLNIQFFFKNVGDGLYQNNWLAAGFTQEDISEGRKRLTKSFFRLDFYDSDVENEQNYLYSEFLDVANNSTPTFNLSGIFWIKNDKKFLDDTTNYRDLYISAKFFNASNGLTTSFVNSPQQSDTDLSELNNNLSIKYTKVRLLNPFVNDLGNFSSKKKVFWVLPQNGNTNNEVKFTQLNFI